MDKREELDGLLLDVSGQFYKLYNDLRELEKVLHQEVDQENRLMRIIQRVETVKIRASSIHDNIYVARRLVKQMSTPEAPTELIDLTL